jgi:hypothetical protein
MDSCDLGCKFGYKKTSNACSTCECFEPCENFNCPVDTKCGVDGMKAVCRPSMNYIIILIKLLIII